MFVQVAGDVLLGSISSPARPKKKRVPQAKISEEAAERFGGRSF